MAVETLLIVIGIALVLWGADRFTDGACGLARRLKVSELVVGLTVVALGTSLPEFVVSFMSVLRQSSDMSVGNIIGSNVFNILVIIGASALFRPLAVEQSLLTRAFPFCFVASAMLVVFAVTGGMIDRWEGLVLVAFFCLYLYVAYRVALADRKDAQTPQPPLGGEARGEEMPVWKILAQIVAGIAVLVVGGRILVDNAALVARELGVSESVIGITILAGGTSLPELATSVIAARKGSMGLAFGNVVGSNVFNIAFVIGLCSGVVPMAVSQITPIDWGVFVGSSLLVWLFAATHRFVSRWEGFLLVLCYLTYIVTLIIK